VCIGGYGAQGSFSTAVYVEDLLSPTSTLMAGGGHFFEVSDNTLTCGYSLSDEVESYPLTRGYIERVEFRTNSKGSVPAMSVTAAVGMRPMTPEDVQACFDERNPKKPHRGLSFLPPTKSYRIDFLFDGHDYKPTPASAAAARAFSAR
jgi:hypothetical protein